jgi:histidinol-phosphate aminotransferase
MSTTTKCGVQARRRLTGLEPYASPAPSYKIDVWLNGNEGLVPPADLLRHVDQATEVLRRYPSVAGLEAQIAARFGLPRECVLVTAGADDALNRACLALLDADGEVILPVPTFEMLERYAQLAGARVVPTPWLSGPYPVNAVLDALTTRTALIAVVSPNNPTGAVASADALRQLSARAPQALLLVDLAYVEFAAADLSATALALPNALVVRTFSKAWGLAGLRVGYAIGPPEVVRWLRCVGNPYAVSGLSAALAQAWFSLGECALREFVARVREERSCLVALLAELGAEPLESEANFVLARFRDAHRVWDGLGQRGIAVRRFPDHPQLRDYLRITCPGQPSPFARLSESLRQVLGRSEEA